jgi:hypothetical protein
VLQRVNPDKPFVLRTDASDFAVGATLEQLVDEARKPTIEDVKQGKNVPVAFFSRKLSKGQVKWVPREKETYAIVMALEKWRSWIGMQPVLVLTDHKALEEWVTEVLNTPSGPIGRRLRWHLMFSKFDLEIAYIPGKDNMIADILSRWAYPASVAHRDISKHGSEMDDREAKEIITQEKFEEEESELFERTLTNIGQPLDASVTLGEEPNLEVAPVGAHAGSPASPPLVFTFKQPGLGPRPGKCTRKGDA